LAMIYSFPVSSPEVCRRSPASPRVRSKGAGGRRAVQGPTLTRRADRVCGPAGRQPSRRTRARSVEIGEGRPPRGAARGLEVPGRRFRPQQTRGDAGERGMRGARQPGRIRSAAPDDLRHPSTVAPERPGRESPAPTHAIKRSAAGRDHDARGERRSPGPDERASGTGRRSRAGARRSCRFPFNSANPTSTISVCCRRT